MSCLRNYFFLFIIISFSDCLVKILFIKDLGLNLMTNKNYLSVMKIFENMKKIQGDCKTIYQYYDKKKTKTKITEKQIQYIKHKLVKLNKINKHWIGMIGKKRCVMIVMTQKLTTIAHRPGFNNEQCPYHIVSYKIKLVMYLTPTPLGKPIVLSILNQNLDISHLCCLRRERGWS